MTAIELAPLIPFTILMVISDLFFSSVSLEIRFISSIFLVYLYYKIKNWYLLRVSE
jgi:hypothetical protein